MKNQYLNNELENVRFVKGMLLVAVIFGHSIAFWGGHWFTQNPVTEAPILGYLYQWIGSFHIYGFTLASGYIFCFVVNERNGYKNYLLFVKTKIKRLIVPYVFVSLLWVLPISMIFFHYSSYQVFEGYILATSPGQLWFLWMLFDVFMLFWPIQKFVHNHTIGSFILVIGLYGIGVICGNSMKNYLQIFNALRFVEFFWIGYKIRQYGSKKMRSIHPVVWITTDIGLLVILNIMPDGGVLYKLVELCGTLLLHVIGAVMAFILLQDIANRIKWKDNRIINFMITYSMPIYLLHQQIIYIALFLLNGIVNPYINAIINFALAIILSALFGYILKSFKTTRFMIGEKS